MAPKDTRRDDDPLGVSTTYKSGQDRSVSDAILQVIADRKDTDLRNSEFKLYEYVDPDALNELFCDAALALIVDFTVDDVHVCCWVDDGVVIRVTDSRDTP